VNCLFMAHSYSHPELEKMCQTFASCSYESYPNRLQILIYNHLQRGVLEVNAYLSLDKQTVQMVTNAKHFARHMGINRFMIEGHPHDTPITRDFYLTVGNRTRVHGMVTGVSPTYTFSVLVPTENQKMLQEALHTLSENWSF
jgi:hypothetical protein